MLELKERYRALTKPAKAAIWFTICNVIQRGIAMITTPIFTRLLPTEEYGTIGIYNSWYSILYIIASLELASGVFNKAMIRYEKDRDGYTSSTLFLATIISLVFFIIYIIIPEYWNRVFSLNTPLMIMLFCEILLSEGVEFWAARNRFDFNYKSVVILTVIANLFGSALSVILILTNEENKIEHKVFGTLLVHAILYGIVYIIVIIKGRKLYAPQYWKYAVRYNLPLIPHYLSQQILNQSDRIMISKMKGMSDAGLYTVAYQVGLIMNMLTTAIHGTFSPWAYQRIREKNTKKIGDITLDIIVIMSVICFLFSLFAPEVILIMGGETYSEAIWVVPPVAMSVVFNMLYSLIGVFAFYYEKTVFVMVGTLSSALINILLNYIFIPIYGFVAAGYTTLFCYLCYSLIHYLFMIHICKENNIKHPFNTIAIWMVALVAVLLSILSTVLYRHNILRYITAIIVVFGILVNIETIINIVTFKKQDN